MQRVLIAFLLVSAANVRGAEVPREHPLTPVLRFAHDRYQRVGTEIQDYSGTLIKRERIDGKLLEQEHLFVKLRHARVVDGRVTVPFGVYLRFLGPAKIKGREIVYVEGQNNGKLIARRGGTRLAYFTKALDPQSELAMRGNRYPVTEIGIKNLIGRLYEVGREDVRYGECDVRYLEDVAVNGRNCTVIQVTHPNRRSNFRYHVARIFVDNKLRVPIRYAAYDWPTDDDNRPVLLEEYTYIDLKLNIGLTDWDFDTRNEAYGFGRNVARERLTAGSP